MTNYFTFEDAMQRVIEHVGRDMNRRQFTIMLRQYAIPEWSYWDAHSKTHHTLYHKTYIDQLIQLAKYE